VKENLLSLSSSVQKREFFFNRLTGSRAGKNNQVNPETGQGKFLEIRPISGRQASALFDQDQVAILESQDWLSIPIMPHTEGVSVKFDQETIPYPLLYRLDGTASARHPGMEVDYPNPVSFFETMLGRPCHFAPHS